MGIFLEAAPPLLGRISSKRKWRARAQKSGDTGNSHGWLLGPRPGRWGACPVRPGPKSTFRPDLFPRELLDVNAQFLSFVLILVQHGSFKEKCVCHIDRDIEGKEEVDDELGNTLGPEPAGCPDLPWLPLLKLSTLSENMCVSSLPKAAGRSPSPRDQSQDTRSLRLGRSDPGHFVRPTPRRGCQEFEP